MVQLFYVVDKKIGIPFKECRFFLFSLVRIGEGGHSPYDCRYRKDMECLVSLHSVYIVIAAFLASFSAKQIFKFCRRASIILLATKGP